uniref:Uncharacterized protein n=1 Tax=Lutzomyia longipalpis TaxID=7200 RepID=A0A1B0CES3_LUTLO
DLATTVSPASRQHSPRDQDRTDEDDPVDVEKSKKVDTNDAIGTSGNASRALQVKRWCTEGRGINESRWYGLPSITSKMSPDRTDEEDLACPPKILFTKCLNETIGTSSIRHHGCCNWSSEDPEKNLP